MSTVLDKHKFITAALLQAARCQFNTTTMSVVKCSKMTIFGNRQELQKMPVLRSRGFMTLFLWLV